MAIVITTAQSPSNTNLLDGQPQWGLQEGDSRTPYWHTATPRGGLFRLWRSIVRLHTRRPSFSVHIVVSINLTGTKSALDWVESGVKLLCVRASTHLQRNPVCSRCLLEAFSLRRSMDELHHAWRLTIFFLLTASRWPSAAVICRICTL